MSEFESPESEIAMKSDDELSAEVERAAEAGEFERCFEAVREMMERFDRHGMYQRVETALDTAVKAFGQQRCRETVKQFAGEGNDPEQFADEWGL